MKRLFTIFLLAFTAGVFATVPNAEAGPVKVVKKHYKHRHHRRHHHHHHKVIIIK